MRELRRYRAALPATEHAGEAVFGRAGSAALLAVLAVVLHAETAAASVDFVRDVRPILERRCYECHGPQRRKGGFRVSNRNDAFSPGELGQELIVPGSSADSELFRLISSRDPATRMPRKREPLGEREIDVIRRWIDEGAAWPADADVSRDHWAYVAPVRPSMPAVRDAAWPRNEIDHFVARRLEREGIEPSPRADDVTLVRRLHLDLIGLPPSPDAIDAYLVDPSPDRYERLVDQLLSSRSYGVRWASPWLDLARYADSTGFQADQLRETWAYRDWVIDALNADMPFDRFTIEQIAGDLLPGGGKAQRVATGFSRAAPLNLEMGVHPEQARVEFELTELRVERVPAGGASRSSSTPRSRTSGSGGTASVSRSTTMGPLAGRSGARSVSPTGRYS